jgi:hypothetical protein
MQHAHIKPAAGCTMVTCDVVQVTVLQAQLDPAFPLTLLAAAAAAGRMSGTHVMNQCPGRV